MSKKQPYIYTMPEGFLNDPSIGVKWKLYAIVNGFWVSGKPCFGGNKFFAEKLGVSERQVRNGFAQLEEEKYITRRVSGNKRVIEPHGKIYVEAEVPLPRGGSESSAAAEVRVPHISVSNSDSINTADADFELEPINKPDLRGEKKKDSATAKYEELCQWAEKRRGFNFVHRAKQYTALKKARESKISIHKLKERWRELESKPFHEENGLDWGMVVSNFDKKA